MNDGTEVLFTLSDKVKATKLKTVRQDFSVFWPLQISQASR